MMMRFTAREFTCAVRPTPFRVIDPILPLLSREVPRGREWTYELKLDGFRGTLYVERGQGTFRSKKKLLLNRFRDLANSLAVALDVEDAVFDGEVVVMRKGLPDFKALFFDRGSAAYVAFDLLWLNGRDLRPLPLWRRRKMLAALVKNTPIATVPATDDARLFDAAKELDLEGIVAKRRNDPYAAGTQWIKVKYAGYSQVQGRWELFRPRRGRP
jgi:bifunctional non-homologous end joining protein LigD